MLAASFGPSFISYSSHASALHSSVSLFFYSHSFCFVLFSLYIFYKRLKILQGYLESRL